MELGPAVPRIPEAAGAVEGGGQQHVWQHRAEGQKADDRVVAQQHTDRVPQRASLCRQWCCLYELGVLIPYSV